MFPHYQFHFRSTSQTSYIQYGSFDMTKNVYVLKQKAEAKLFQCLGILQIMILMIQMQTAV